jgi:hypothetical protein
MAMNHSHQEDWAQAFQFSEDLQHLEAWFQEKTVSQTSAKPASNPLKPDTTATNIAGSKDAQFLEALSETIAHRLGDYLAEPEILSQYFKMTELEKDNALMASQIEELLKRLHQKEQENQALKDELERQYQHLLGNLYIRRPG